MSNTNASVDSMENYKLLMGDLLIQIQGSVSDCVKRIDDLETAKPPQENHNFEISYQLGLHLQSRLDDLEKKFNALMAAFSSEKLDLHNDSSIAKNNQRDISYIIKEISAIKAAIKG